MSYRRPLLRLAYLGLLVAGVAVLAVGWYRLGTSETNPLPDRYVEGVVGSASHPSPLFGQTAVDADLAALLFSGLTRVESDGTPAPDLAERWEVTADGLAYTFHLRQNLRWHDGEVLDADDVAFTVAAVQDPQFKGAPALASRWTGVRVEVPDARTVVFRLPAPAAGFLSQTDLGIVPEHLLQGRDAAGLLEAALAMWPTGSGPYRLARAGADGAVLEGNPAYHFGLPSIQRLELRFYRDTEALTNALGAGEVDGALLEETPALGEAEVLARPGLRQQALITAGYTALYFNNRRAPLDDPALRRALAGALDRPALVREALGGRGQTGDGPVIPGTWAYAVGAWPAPGSAEPLFGLAGWLRDAAAGGLRRNGDRVLRLELLTNSDPVREALAAAIASQLRPQGIEVNVTAVPASALLAERIPSRNYDLLLFGWDASADPDPYAGWHASQVDAPGLNIAAFRDPIADGLLEAGQRTLDIAERRDLYAKFQARFVQQAPSVVLVYPERVYALPSTLAGPVKGVLFEPSDRFREVHRWRFVPGGDASE